MNFLSKILNRHYVTSEFKRKNKILFSSYKKKLNQSSKILVEFNAFQNTHLAISYLSNVLSDVHKSEINAYFSYSLLSSPLQNTFLNNLKWNIGNFLGAKNFGVYKSFGTTKIFKPKITKEVEDQSLKISKKIFSQIKNNNDVLNIKIKKILVGDLLYDTYLKRFIEPTVDIKSQKFYELLKDFVKLFLYWENYLKKNKVKAIIGVHTPYSYGLILRIGIHKKIPVYATSTKFLYFLNKNMSYMHGHFKDFSKNFKKLNKLYKLKAIAFAKRKLQIRFKGFGGAKAHLLTSEISSFKSSKYKNLIKQNKKIKILIAPHDFFDAVHIFGKTLFPDFYLWMNHLGNLSENTDYDWYIKNRPNYPGKFKIYQPYTNQLIKELVEKFPRINILPNEYSHHQIIKEKIDFVLTCYGSVGVEYPFFRVPVINASVNNPHINYKFNIHPKTIKEYDYILKNLSKFKKNNKTYFSKNKIYEYYFMRNIFIDREWLIDNYQKMLNFVGGNDGQFTYRIYEYWLKNHTLKKHEKIVERLKNFINSKENFMNAIHTNKKLL